MSRTWLSIGILSAGSVLTLWVGNRATPALAAQHGRSGELHVLKNCDDYNGQPGQSCAIRSSNLPELAGARVFYDQAAGIPNPNPPRGMLDSNVLLYVGANNWAVGRCTVDGNTGLGLCKFSDGVGKARRISRTGRGIRSSRREQFPLGRSLPLQRRLRFKESGCGRDCAAR
jgi:hypothetical protein